MSNPKAVRNLVIGLFAGFFLAAAVAIFIAVKLDRQRQAEINALSVSQQTEIRKMVADNAEKIEEIERKSQYVMDSLNLVIQKQTLKVESLTSTVSLLKREQRVLMLEIEQIQTERDSLLQGIKLDE